MEAGYYVAVEGKARWQLTPVNNEHDDRSNNGIQTLESIQEDMGRSNIGRGDEYGGSDSKRLCRLALSNTEVVFPTFRDSFRRTKLRHAIAQHPQVRITYMYSKVMYLTLVSQVMTADITTVRGLKGIY